MQARSTVVLDFITMGGGDGHLRIHVPVKLKPGTRTKYLKAARKVVEATREKSGTNPCASIIKKIIFVFVFIKGKGGFVLQRPPEERPGGRGHGEEKSLVSHIL